MSIKCFGWETKKPENVRLLYLKILNWDLCYVNTIQLKKLNTCL